MRKSCPYCLLIFWLCANTYVSQLLAQSQFLVTANTLFISVFCLHMLRQLCLVLFVIFNRIVTVFTVCSFAVMLHNSLKFLSERRVRRSKTCIIQTYSLCACPQFGTCYLAFVVGSSLLYLCFVNCFIMNQSVSLLDGAFSYFSCRNLESRLYDMSFFSLLKVVQLTLIASF